MKLLIPALLSFGLSWSVLTQAAGLSPHRNSNETYEVARFRNLLPQGTPDKSPFRPYQDLVTNYVTADRAQKPMEDLDLNSIPEAPSYEALVQEFEFIRDTRFLNQDPHFPRRLTWMYPDDGCYARAEIAKTELIKNRFVAPKKIFVFGNLTALSENGVNGEVTWWYHVAVTYRVGSTVFVFDPSLYPQRPLTLQEWNLDVGGAETSVRYAICSADTFDPRSPCETPQPVSEEMAQRAQNSFLQPEWSRIKYLGRDPEAELGDSPPWLLF